jgi:hypothetical protein
MCECVYISYILKTQECQAWKSLSHVCNIKCFYYTPFTLTSGCTNTYTLLRVYVYTPRSSIYVFLTLYERLFSHIHTQEWQAFWALLPCTVPHQRLSNFQWRSTPVSRCVSGTHPRVCVSVCVCVCVCVWVHMYVSVYFVHFVCVYIRVSVCISHTFWRRRSARLGNLFLMCAISNVFITLPLHSRAAAQTHTHS